MSVGRHSGAGIGLGLLGNRGEVGGTNFLRLMSIRPFFLLVVALFQREVVAQYQPLAVEGAQWIIYETFDEGFSDQIISHHNYFIQGDTTLQGQLYKKVYFRYLDNSVIGGPQNLTPPFYTSTPAILAGFVRDAIAEQKVYGIALLEPTDVFFDDCIYSEALLYDFNLAVGDTLRGCWHTSSLTFNDTTYIQNITVDSITNITWSGGNHLVYQLEDSGDLFQRIIEGIGGDNGPFTWTTADIAFTGAQQEFLIDYCIGTDVACGLEPTRTTRPEAYPDLQLYPNPAAAATQIVLTTPLSAEGILRVVDATGRTLQSASWPVGTAAYMLDLTDYPPGFYTLTLQSAAGRTTRKLIIR